MSRSSLLEPMCLHSCVPSLFPQTVHGLWYRKGKTNAFFHMWIPGNMMPKNRRNTCIVKSSLQAPKTSRNIEQACFSRVSPFFQCFGHQHRILASFGVGGWNWKCREFWLLRSCGKFMFLLADLLPAHKSGVGWGSNIHSLAHFYDVTPRHVHLHLRTYVMLRWRCFTSRRGWGGVGWGSNVHSLAHFYDVTPRHVHLHLRTYVMLRWRCFTSRWAGVGWRGVGQ